MKRSTIVEAIALLFIILFLYTGISKLMDYPVAREQIGLTPLLAPIAGLIAIVLPIAEVITALLLFIPRTRMVGLQLTLALMVLFTGYIVYILRHDAHLPCTCGGILQQMTWTQHLIFNGICIALSLLAVLWQRINTSGAAVNETVVGMEKQLETISKRRI